MPYDMVHLNVLTHELADALNGGRIERVTMPERDEVVLSVRNNAQNYNLLISCAPSEPRVHLTRQKKENPLNAFAFCMLLRKYLEKSTVESITLLNGDRLIAFRFRSKNELFDDASYTLILELMSRCSNLFLIDTEYKILGAAKQGFLNDNAERTLLTGARYTFPKNEKIRICDLDGVRGLLKNQTVGALDNCLYAELSGLSRESARELLYRADIVKTEFPLTDDELSRLIAALKDFLDLSSQKKPCVSIKNGKKTDFYVIEYSIKGFNPEYFDTLNAAADEIFTRKDFDAALNAKAKSLKDVLKKVVVRTQKKIADNLDSLSRAQNAEVLKRSGNLILNYIYTLKKNQSELTAIDYETDEIMTVALDINLSPSENSAAYFKKYAKLTRTEESARKNLAQNETYLDYLLSIDRSISLGEDLNTLNGIETEMTEIGLIRKKQEKSVKNNKNKKPKEKPVKLYECTLDGFKIYAGRNNVENDYATFSVAKNSDVWLHTKSYHGSHVIIACEGRAVPTEVLTLAASVAAYYSEARGGTKVAVDYTEKRNVKKIPAAGKGMVTYSDFKTLLVDPLKK
ncbi:MAG: NFACT family protein [Clostridiales bacterium]|jgi:predicted ribosome quality control (RQC) complex YloA/Tae2 family protein|nr:NFACT family protein [Clostridiales bacterium]